MRYIIDTEGEKAQDWGNTLRRAAERGELTIIEKTDPIEVMKENLRNIARAMEVLNKNGISKELMESYIYDKTKVAKRDIALVLGEQKRFFEKLGVKLKWENLF